MRWRRREGDRAYDVTWHTEWHTDIGRDLALLPSSPACPNDLYASLLEGHVSPDRPVATVRDGNGVVGLIGLMRATGGAWEPITNWVTPGFVCPTRPGDLVPTLTSLDRRLRVAWWELGEPPNHRLVRGTRPTVLHRLAVADREAFWRSSGQWKNVTSARRKCAALEVRAAHPGDVRLVFEAADRQHGVNSSLAARLREHIEVAEYMQRQGRAVSLTLCADDEPVAGLVVLTLGSMSMSGAIFRDPSVGNLPTGVRLFDVLFEWAEQTGIEVVDLGGGFDYKTKWAPPAGHHYQLDMLPTRAVVADQLAGLPARARRAAGRVIRSAQRRWRPRR